MIKKVIIIGPAHPLRGGLATFDHRLAREFLDEGFECSIYSFSLQYPSLLFPGKTQFSEEPPPPDIRIFSKINSINPFNWFAIGKAIKALNPDLVISRFWIPFMGPSLGTILRQVRKNKRTKIIGLIDNIKPHEKRAGDHALTKYFLGSVDAFITMSEKVTNDLALFKTKKPVQQIVHPLYDSFGQPVEKMESRRKLGISETGKLILFFGFIREYKGLDILLNAMANPEIKNSGIKLLIAGEFYEPEERYSELINKLGIKDQLILRTEFIPDNEVRYYLSAADVVVQPYRNATQSGVTPLAYHFEKPTIVTNVGGLPELVPHEKAGIVCEPNPDSIAGAIIRFYELGENFFIPHLRLEKQKFSWKKMVDSFIELAEKV